MNIFIRPKFKNSEKEILKKGADKVNLIFGHHLENHEAKEQFMRAEVAFGNIPAEWLVQSSKIKWLQLESVGFDAYRNLKWDNLDEQITITNLKGMFGVPVAETAVAGILSLYRGINRLTCLKTEKKWTGSDLRPQLKLLHNKSVLILGGGSIGRTIKSLLKAFNCDIAIFGRTASSGDFFLIRDLDQKLPTFDLVISCLPETPKTVGLFDKERLKRLKKSALFVNVGRGSVVGEQALVEALNHNRLGGAVLDVTQHEPLPEDHPLWECPNTIITQHTGGGSENELENKVNIFLENLDRYKAGKKLANIVDFKKGY